MYFIITAYKCELVVELGKKATYAKSVPCEPLVW